MLLFKRYIIILILTVFVLGAVASSAMAHCGQFSSAALDGTVSFSMAHHNEDTDKSEAACDSHDHGSASVTEIASGHSSDHGATPTDCNDCFGVSCQSKMQVPEGVAPVQCKDIDEVHSQDSIHFKNIFLSIIPNPPNSIS